MPIKVLLAYAAHLPARLAERQLRLAEVTSFPHVKPSARRQMQREWERAIRASGGAAARKLPREHYAGALAMMGVTVETARRDESAESR